MVKIDHLPSVQVTGEMKELIERTVETVLLMEGDEGCEVSVFLTDDAEIQRLNKLYRDVDRPTDVLAFAMREGADGELNREILGDVVISVPRAEEQSSIYGHDLSVEMSILVAHGVLHLLGYEHEQEDDVLVMRRKLRDVLRFLGYGSVELGDIAGGTPEHVDQRGR